MASWLQDALETISGAAHYHAWLYHQLEADLGSRVLDVGSGLGALPALFAGAGPRRIIVSDADDEMLQHLRRRFAASAAYEVRRLAIDQLSEADVTRAEPVDTITCVNVLEHIRDDGRALRQMHRLLAPDGKLLLIVPALPALFGTLDAAAGHYRRYTRRGLSAQLRQAGFRVAAQRYMNCLGVLTWWLAGRVLRRRRFHAGACAFLDRLVPWLERLEQRVPPPFGQSLVTICLKARVREERENST